MRGLQREQKNKKFDTLAKKLGFLLAAGGVCQETALRWQPCLAGGDYLILGGRANASPKSVVWKTHSNEPEIRAYSSNVMQKPHGQHPFRIEGRKH